jgi:hypothetical protein
MILGYEELDRAGSDKFRPIIWADVDEILEPYRSSQGDPD